LGALCMLAFGSLACLMWGFKNIPLDDRPKNSKGKLRFPWRLVLVLGVYEFVLGVQESLQGSSGDGITEIFALSTVAASLVLFGFSYFLSHRFDFTLIFQTPFVFMGCGLIVAFSTLLTNNNLAQYLISTGYSLMFLLLVVMFCDISHRFGIAAIALCGIKDAMEFFLVAGHGTGSILQSSAIPEGNMSLFMGILATGVFLVSFVLLLDRKNSQWSLSFFGVGTPLNDNSGRAAFFLRCSELAEAYGLSPREKEVFQLLALEKSFSSIERDLCIAKGTLKSHTRRIYQKMSIHSRQELHDIVGEAPVA
ncbi:MAG: LuxR C-terminal-related transcriptional regulator, partial [Raoultibacter sp.]